jgi:2',3'-cyclic-nucleotide 2'-phosphodiesterase (5'-nucleotidase family)
MKRIWMLIFTILILISLTACDREPSSVVNPTEPDDEVVTTDRGELVILFTGGLEGTFARDESQGALGYAAMKAYANELEDDHKQVILVDGGCSLDVPGEDGLWDIVDGCGYDYRVPGIVELVSGVDELISRAEGLRNCNYISCNLVNLSDQTTVFEPYALIDVSGIQVGIVGVTAPGALAACDLDSYRLLGFDDSTALYDAVQKAVDAATEDGASFVIVAGNLGTSVEKSPYTAAEVISDITGMVVWLDCGSGSVLDGDTVTDKDDFEIPMCAPGYDFRYIGQVILDLNEGTVEVELITELEKEARSVNLLIQDFLAE